MPSPAFMTGARLDSATLWKRYEGLLGTGPVAMTRITGREPATGGGRTLEAVYRAPYLAHAPMEPMDAVARLTGDERRDVQLAAPEHSTELPGALAAAAELDTRVQAAIAALPDQQRLALVLFSIEELPQKDVAAILNQVAKFGGGKKPAAFTSKEVARVRAEGRKTTTEVASERTRLVEAGIVGP